MNPYIIRRAEAHEHAIVMALLDEVTQWLTARGIDQWQDRMEIWSPRVATAIDQGEVWLLTSPGDGLPLGTLTLDDHADPDFWGTGHDLDQTSARYLHKLAVRRDVAGQELGRLLLDWARDRAAREHAEVVRLDAWRSNPGLHQYYRDRGWTQSRTVHLDHRRSGTLFTAPAERTAVWDRLVEAETLPTCLRRPERWGADEAGNRQPEHFHTGGAQLILAGDHRPTLATWMPETRNWISATSGGWEVRQNDLTSYRPLVGTIVSTEIPLAEDLTYEVEHRADPQGGCRITTTASRR